MKRLILTFALAIGVGGCIGSYVPTDSTGTGGHDMAQAVGTGGNGGTGGAGGGGAGGTGGGGSGGGGGDHGTSTDMAMPMHDLAGVTPGTAAFGATCTVDGDCQSLMCRQFVMGTVHRCTKACTVATQATDCPAPSAGVCTNNGYCKFNQ